MAAASSSSQVPCGKYDVFISFRGPDVKFGFLSHLKEELSREHIDVYVDDRLERGDEISSALLEAIEGSMIALVIFSKDYASSRWCLEELVKIMECKKDRQQIVIPVFYDVDPSDVRYQKGTYAEAFTRHEEKFKGSVGNLLIWRSVLGESANLSGYHSSKFRNESELIEAIVKDVLKKLEDNSPIMPESHLIGFHQNFTSVESLMEIELQDVRILGIWGMGGIGKTTLAHAIFDKFLTKFESGCFLENVRERATNVDGLNSLHQKLISELLNKQGDIDMKAARRRLKRKKVLIVLDDVNDSEQLEVLVGQPLLLGSGSRIIVTSRNKHIVWGGEILDNIHEVKALNFEESLELFCRHAFNQSHPKMGYQELSRTTVAIVLGIPLALKVLGSHFHSRDPAYWKSELRKLKMYPNKKIQNILKISYDGLDLMDKEIFLDIAFFFVGDKKDNVICGLEACGFTAVSGIQNLIDKALIKLDEYGCIVMHDLIREMAEQIVRGENMRPPERLSRLKDANEIYNVLKSNMGSDEIEGIILDLRSIEYVPVQADSFVRMKNLRFLKFLGWSYSRTYRDLISCLGPFPNELRYLHWDCYPLETLPTGFYLKNLVELHIEWSNVQRLWDGKQDLGNLKKINLSFSKRLIELPDLSMTHKLESINLTGCESLRSVHPSILSLPNIIEMHVYGYSELESIKSDETHLEGFSFNYIVEDWRRKIFFSSKKLCRLCVEETEVERLHFPIIRFREDEQIIICGGMVGSVSLDELRCLTNLEVFEVINLSFFYALHNLRELCLDGCSELSEIPDNIMVLTKLRYFSLNDSAVETLPACFNHLSSLEIICLRRCKRLKSIIGLPPSLQHLDASECTLLETVSSVSLVWNKCSFNFCNCEKLDERSLCYIQELILSSMTSASDCYDDDDGPGVITCYPGSRVPEWMEYKPMTEALNATELTCNLARSQDLLICCVAPHLGSKKLGEVSCCFPYDDNYEFPIEHTLEYPAFDRDHVLLWTIDRSLYDAGRRNDAKISFEFFLSYWEEKWQKNGGRRCRVPAKACGAHLIYHDLICHPL